MLVHQALVPRTGFAPPVLRKNLRGDWFQHVVMMQAAETGMGNDAMSGW